MSLKTTKKKTALQLLEYINRQRTLEKLGIVTPAVSRNRFETLGEVIPFYTKGGTPKADGTQRTQEKETNARLYCSRLVSKLGPVRISQFNASSWKLYTEERIKEGAGASTVDSKFQALRIAFLHASRHPDETVIFDPPAFRWVVKRYKTEDAKRCRDYQPKDADELHEIASSWRQGASRHATLGWCILFQAMLCVRISELLKLRMDAKNQDDPGYDDVEHLWLCRSKTSKGTASFASVHPALRETMSVHKQWHSQTFSNSPWYFPSRKKLFFALRQKSISRLVRDWSNEHCIKRTSHGLRSYYGNVRRSQGVADAQIALEIGHKTGGKLIVDTYGEVLPI